LKASVAGVGAGLGGGACWADALTKGTASKAIRTDRTTNFIYISLS
jgi:hypothetical protein